ncbi:hypothetical protein [Lysobacter gummosus]
MRKPLMRASRDRPHTRFHIRHAPRPMARARVRIRTAGTVRAWS